MMNSAGGTDIFYGGIAVFRGFSSLMDPKLYSPLPDDWTIGVADIVESTRAIAAQRYKAVNMAGAAVIAAGNLGCMIQIGQRSAVPVVHTVELLDWATGGPRPLALRGRP